MPLLFSIFKEHLNATCFACLFNGTWVIIFG